MSKYQEHKETIKHNYPPENYSMLREALDVSMELLDKATPMKPLGYHTNYKCPSCDKRVRSGKGSSSHIKDTVCRNCYQVLDWSEEE